LPADLLCQPPFNLYLLIHIEPIRDCPMTATAHTPHEQMLSQQSAPGMWWPRVLQALRSVSRETFAPDGYRELALPIPIAAGQRPGDARAKTGRQDTEAVNVQETEQVLLIGAGSGQSGRLFSSWPTRCASSNITLTR
jgi:hypothetical protein